VKVLGVAVAVGLPVALACSASQEVKVLFPKKTPTVSASVKWMVCSVAAARVALLAQKLIVKLKVLARPLQMGTTVVPVVVS
jgi:hypothetical protein